MNTLLKPTLVMVLLAMGNVTVFAEEPSARIPAWCQATRTGATSNVDGRCIGILAQGRVVIRAMVSRQEVAAATKPEAAWQERYDKAVARKQKGNTLFWSGATMVAAGIGLSTVPSINKYCYNYPAAECAKHIGPLLGADVLGAILMLQGGKVRAAAIRELAILDRERRGVF